MRKSMVCVAMVVLALWPSGAGAAPLVGDSWTFEDDLTGVSNPAPWVNSARWHYMSGHTGDGLDQLTDFYDFNNYTGSQWQTDAVAYPSLKVTDGTLHPDGGAGDLVSAASWEANWTGQVRIDYSVKKASTGTVGYRLLHWDASSGTMQVLRNRALLSGGAGTTTPPLVAHASVEPGDHILYVVDNHGSGGGDRSYLYETVTAAPNWPTWHFHTQLNDSTNPGPWIGNAQWQYLTADTASGLDDIADFSLFDSLSSGTWTKSGLGNYPQVRVTDATLHPGTGTIVAAVGWLANCSGNALIDYEAQRENATATGDGVGYQLLLWDASVGAMLTLQSRATLAAGLGNPATGPLFAQTWVDPGDYILFVLDNNGTGSMDRTWLYETITLVPEPGTMTLMGVGLAALGLRRRRRRQAPR